MGDALAQHRHAEMVSQQQRDQAKQTHAWDQAAGVSGQGEQATSSDVARRVRKDTVTAPAKVSDKPEPTTVTDGTPKVRAEQPDRTFTDKSQPSTRQDRPNTNGDVIATARHEQPKAGAENASETQSPDGNARIKVRGKQSGVGGTDQPNPVVAKDAAKDRADKLNRERFILHLVYVGDTPPDKETRDKTQKRIEAELQRVGENTRFYIAQYWDQSGHGSTSGNPLEHAKLGPRDFVVYMVRQPDSVNGKNVETHGVKRIHNLAKVHVPRELLNDSNIDKIRRAIAPQTSTDIAHGQTIVDTQSKKGVSFVRNEDLSFGRHTTDEKGRYLGETVLHELGHQLLDVQRIDKSHNRESHFVSKTHVSIMTERNTIGQQERHFTEGEVRALKRELRLR